MQNSKSFIIIFHWKLKENFFCCLLIKIIRYHNRRLSCIIWDCIYKLIFIESNLKFTIILSCYKTTPMHLSLMKLSTIYHAIYKLYFSLSLFLIIKVFSFIKCLQFWPTKNSLALFFVSKKLSSIRAFSSITNS